MSAASSQELQRPAESFTLAWERLFVWALQAEERYLSEPNVGSEDKVNVKQLAN